MRRCGGGAVSREHQAPEKSFPRAPARASERASCGSYGQPSHAQSLSLFAEVEVAAFVADQGTGGQGSIVCLPVLPGVGVSE